MNTGTVSKVLEKDYGAIRTALELGKDYATQVLQGHDMMYKRHPATEGERKEIVDDVVTLNHRLAALLASRGQGEMALYLLGELMSYNNFQSYPPNLKERVGTFMAQIENGIAPD